MTPGPFTAAAAIRSTRNRRRTKRHPYTIPAAALAILSAVAAIVAALNL